MIKISVRLQRAVLHKQQTTPLYCYNILILINKKIIIGISVRLQRAASGSVGGPSDGANHMAHIVLAKDCFGMRRRKDQPMGLRNNVPYGCQIF